jgi:hypothetical protein
VRLLAVVRVEAAAARAGIYTPHRESMFCNRGKCAYWRACEEEFGGEVAGRK